MLYEDIKTVLDFLEARKMLAGSLTAELIIKLIKLEDEQDICNCKTRVQGADKFCVVHGFTNKQ